MKTALELIADERHRQITEKGWTPEHDDTHADGALSAAAAHLIAHADEIGNVEVASLAWQNHEWIEGLIVKHGTNPDRCLVIAGALIVAELERRRRCETKETFPENACPGCGRIGTRVEYHGCGKRCTACQTIS